MGDEAMRRFVKGNGDNYRDHPDGRQVEHIRQAAVLRARLPHLLRSEATGSKKRKIGATILANVRFSDHAAQRYVIELLSAGGHSQAREADCEPASSVCVTRSRRYCRACPRSWPQWLLLTKRLERRCSC